MYYAYLKLFYPAKSNCILIDIDSIKKSHVSIYKKQSVIQTTIVQIAISTIKVSLLYNEYNLHNMHINQRQKLKPGKRKRNTLHKAFGHQKCIVYAEECFYNIYWKRRYWEEGVYKSQDIWRLVKVIVRYMFREEREKKGYQSSIAEIQFCRINSTNK